ncbi:ribokinase [Nordella sp. HKS 07]|uniref:PfkB family carbohydrate kinase n=1 Tax=Nordella sp. HKS 07 TaxID=2712222 RepID=UPI0013E1E924|nr:PfkB family carbohydrate kinase [Nordella sp. HKS 07]QIG49802.1 ribokinase [Nordella sp. HKS 07]
MTSERPRLVVIGNACLDVTYHLDRLPKAGETLNATRVITDLGGKGLNQAVAAERAGASVHLIAAVGNDQTSEKIRAALHAEGMTDQGLIAREGASDDSILLLDIRGENVIVSNTLQAQSLKPAEAEAGLPPVLKDAALLLLQGNLSFETTLHAMKLARQAGVAIAFNPSPLQPWFDHLPEADLVIANEIEAEALGSRTGRKLTVITLGAKGCRIARPGQADVAVIAPTVEAIAAGGAGDVFAGTFVAEWLAQGDAEKAARLGVSAASDKATRHGTLSAFPTRATLAQLRRALLSLPA